MDTNEIDALISLIDDPDESVYVQVRNRIVSYGETIIPQLENVWELNSFGIEFQQRIEDIIHDIQFDSVYKSLERWSRDGAKDLFDGAIIVAHYQYPDLDEDQVKANLMKVRQDVWLELNDELTALEKVNVMNHVIFDIHGYRANKKNFHAAQNSYINTVLESKKGNPLSLSVIYLVIAEYLGIPIYGVNLPNHFLLAYIDANNIIHFIENQLDPEVEKTDVLFYINAFNKGTIVHKTEISAYIEQLNLAPKSEYFQACDNRTIVLRLLNNLIFSYDRLGYPEKVSELKKLCEAVGKFT